MIYTRPKYFEDLSSLPAQSSNWEFTVLYNGPLGMRVIINLDTIAYLGVSWNDSSDRRMQLFQL